MDFRRFLKGYYIVNAILLIVYPVSRVAWIRMTPGLSAADTMGYTRETNFLGILAMIAAIKFYKSATAEQFFMEIFFYGKVFIFGLYIFVDPKISIIYLFASIVIWLFFKLPKYDGPTRMVRIQNEEEFNKLISKETRVGNKVASPSELPYEKMSKMWFVELYVDWADTCQYTKSIWAEFSNKYTTERFGFATVNLQKIPEIAKRFQINTSGLSRQLPTLILFEEGKEYIRFPPIEEKTGKIGRVLKYDKKQLAKYFDLEKRFLATREAAARKS
eukprot:TRINITY_DN3273_c0_g2_i2.p1 TRINITY_DN3273_c0_g2~~TRINITY_DN3273_c0_g2_i2.p1  ORF type:complete len:274 (-),score=59.32 TRINITY_DN3273_c0_g2_i2:95-916(-)